MDSPSQLDDDHKSGFSDLGLVPQCLWLPIWGEMQTSVRRIMPWQEDLSQNVKGLKSNFFQSTFFSKNVRFQLTRKKSCERSEKLSVGIALP